MRVYTVVVYTVVYLYPPRPGSHPLPTSLPALPMRGSGLRHLLDSWDDPIPENLYTRTVVRRGSQTEAPVEAAEPRQCMSMRPCACASRMRRMCMCVVHVQHKCCSGPAVDSPRADPNEKRAPGELTYGHRCIRSPACRAGPTMAYQEARSFSSVMPSSPCLCMRITRLCRWYSK